LDKRKIEFLSIVILAILASLYFIVISIKILDNNFLVGIVSLAVFIASDILLIISARKTFKKIKNDPDFEIFKTKKETKFQFVYYNLVRLISFLFCAYVAKSTYGIQFIVCIVSSVLATIFIMSIILRLIRIKKILV